MKKSSTRKVAPKANARKMERKVAPNWGEGDMMRTSLVLDFLDPDRPRSTGKSPSEERTPRTFDEKRKVSWLKTGKGFQISEMIRKGES